MLLAAVLLGLAAGGGVLLATRALTGCSQGNDAAGLTRCDVTEGYLRSRPVAQLVYPRATLVSTTGQDQEHPLLDDVNYAYVQWVYFTPDSASVVQAWYRSQLDAMGFGPVPGTLGYPRTSDYASRESARENFRVAFNAPPGETGYDLRLPVPPHGQFVFTVGYTIAPARPTPSG